MPTQTTLSVFKNIQDRYPNTEEAQALKDYTESVPLRMAALNALQAQEDAILGPTCTRIFEKHPKVEKRVEGYEKTHRDMALILRYVGQAMLKNDMRFLEDTLLHWLATMLQAFKLGQDCLYDSYIYLEEETEKRLSTEHYALLKPYMQRVTQLVPEKETQNV